MSSTIRLTLNVGLQEGLDLLKSRYPFLSYDEILKLALSKLYAEEVDKEKSVKKSKLRQVLQAITDTPGGIDFKNEEEMSNWWMQNKNKLRGAHNA